MREMRSLLAPFVVVMAAAVVVLAAADRVPAWLAGATHGARVYRTLAEAEAALGARLLVPAFYPDTLAWPPSRIEVAPGPPPVAAIRVARRAGAIEALVICQSIGRPAPPPPWLLPPLPALRAADVPLRRHAGRLTRRLTPGGRVVHDLTWTGAGRQFTLRYEGAVDDLLRMARALDGDARDDALVPRPRW